MEERKPVELKKISNILWEIPKEGGMKVPCRVYASESLLEKMKQDRTLMQGRNVAFLPGIYKYALVMPDGHEGYGFPIGGVAALETMMIVIMEYICADLILLIPFQRMQ